MNDDNEFLPERSIPADQLEDRAVYVIYCRNLFVGMWNAERHGFTGIREKFGDKYLFMEYHWEAGPPYGTARAYEKLDVVVPEEIPNTEYLGSFCQHCDTPVKTRGSGEVERDGEMVTVQCIGYTHVNAEDREKCEREGGYMACAKMNKALFDFLVPLDQAEWERRRVDIPWQPADRVGR